MRVFSDFVRHAVSHGLDKAQILGFNFQFSQLLALREILGGEQRGNWHCGIAALKRHDIDVVNGAGGIFRFVTERPHCRAGFQHLINFCAEGVRQVAEFELASALVFLAEMPFRGFVRVQHFQIVADDDACAAQFAQHVGHHFVIAGNLVVQPDVAERQGDLFEQMENQFQFRIDERFAGDAAIENGDADKPNSVGDRHGDLRAKHFKFLSRVGVGAGLVAVTSQNPSQPHDLAADARIKREFKMFEQAGRKTDGSGRRAKETLAAVFPRNGSGDWRTRTVQKNGGTVDAHHFAKEGQELIQHRLGELSE